MDSCRQCGCAVLPRTEMLLLGSRRRGNSWSSSETKSVPTCGRRQKSSSRFCSGTSKAIEESDKARADYLKRFYGIDRELPTHYDLVVNTDVLTADQAAVLVVQAASSVRSL